ncbi:MAG: hypothetical protein WDN25_13540 [Acetobacteraceae bacterium]
MSRLLTEAGEALYGPRWQSEIARDLGCNVRTVQRWVSGTIDPPVGIWVDLLRLTQERAMTLDALAERLKSATSPEL